MREFGAERNSIDRYRQEVRGRSTLDENQISGKIHAYQQHPDDIDSRNAVVEHYLPYAMGFARKYAEHGIDYEDLVQACNQGLMDAVEDYDPDKEAKFETHAGWKMRGRITETFRKNQRIFRPSQETLTTWNQIRTTMDTLRDRLGRAPAAREIAEAMREKDERKIEEAIRDMDMMVAVSLDELREGRPGEPARADARAELGDTSFLNPEQGSLMYAEIGEVDSEIKSVLLALEHVEAPERDKHTFIRRYGLDGSYEVVEVGVIAAEEGRNASKVSASLNNIWRRISVSSERGRKNDAWLVMRLRHLHDLRELASGI